jgi:hypothetical protein
MARERYRSLIGEPGSKPLVNLVDEFVSGRALSPEVFAHFYHVRRHGNPTVYGSDVPGTSGVELVFSILGATVKIVTWHRLSDRIGRGQSNQEELSWESVYHDLPAESSS